MIQVRSHNAGPALLYRIILIITLISFMGSMMAQKYPTPPEGSNFVIDFAQVMSIDEKDALDVMLTGFYDTASIAVVIVTVKETGGQEINEFATGLSEEWGLGAINGEKALLILLKSDSPVKLAAIAVNFENNNDINLKIDKILYRQVLPLVKKGRYYQAINKGTDLIFKVLSGNFNEVSEDTEDSSRSGRLFTIILATTVLILSLRRIFISRRIK